MKTLLAVIVTLLLLLAIVPDNEAEGPVILAGGGTIPDRAIQLLKEHRREGKFVVVSYYEGHRGKWDEALDNPIFTLPTDLHKIPLRRIAGVLIEGGDQWTYLNQLNGEYLQKIHDHGIPILGTSAGAMILGDYYFSAEKGTINSEQAKKNINVCLGHTFVHFKCLADTIIDTHYRNRDRQGRLEVFQEKTGAKRAIGIDEQTAIYINGDKVETMGEGVVSVYPQEKPIASIAGL